MSDAWIAALSALATGVLSLIGVYLANRKSAALIEYRMQQLEKKVDKHNSLIDRMYKVEGRLDVIEKTIKIKEESSE